MISGKSRVMVWIPHKGVKSPELSDIISQIDQHSQSSKIQIPICHDNSVVQITADSCGVVLSARPRASNAAIKLTSTRIHAIKVSASYQGVSRLIT